MVNKEKIYLNVLSDIERGYVSIYNYRDDANFREFYNALAKDIQQYSNYTFDGRFEKLLFDELKISIHVLPSGDENAVHWFLEDKIDTRASNYLEDAATEIQVQGLELDYTCLLWDADMRYENGEWRFYRFNGQTKRVEQTPTSESKQDLMKYMLNAYRVLLTRARAGMVICVPEGNGNKTVSGFWEDSTRLPEYYNGTYEYLKSLGIEEI